MLLRYYLTLAGKNLWRHKRRTILTFLAVAIGLYFFIILDSIMQGLDRESIENLINLETSHLQVHAPGYWEEREELPLDHLLPDAEQTLKRLEELPEVQAATPRLFFMARLNNGVDELPVQGVGIDPFGDSSVFSLARYLVQGRYLQPGKYEALLGKELAELMEVGLGEPFTLVMRTPQGTFQAIDLEVVGLLEAPHPEVNSVFVYLPLDVAQEALGIPGTVSEIDVRAAKKEEVPALLQRIGKLPGVEAYSWRELAQDFLRMSETERVYDSVMLGLIFLIALVGVVNTVLLATLERTKEIGTLKAMGLTGGEILFLFVAEAGLLGVLGGVGGVALAIITELYLVNYGMDYSSLLQGTDWGYPFSGIIYGEWNPEIMVAAFLSGIVVCMLASLLPAKRAARLDAAVALRNL